MNVNYEIDELVQQLTQAIERQDSRACAMLYTEDAWMLCGNRYDFRERDNIELFFKYYFLDFEPLPTKVAYNFGMRVEHRTLHADDTIAYSIAHFEEDLKYHDGLILTHSGKCICVYKRASNNGWRIHIMNVAFDEMKKWRRRYDREQ